MSGLAYSPWHTVTVTSWTGWNVTTGETETDYDHDVEHAPECDALKYGEQCWFDRDFWELRDIYSELETALHTPGRFRARVWGSGPDHNGEYDGGIEWEPVEDPQPAQVPA